MASEILGLFNTPSVQQLRNAALDSSMVSPAQMGQQGLLQQVVSMGQNAGAMMGMGAGQLFGGKVAGEVEAGYINDAIQYAAQKGGTPSEKMGYVAEFLADKPGMGAQYMKAAEEKRKLELQDLQLTAAQRAKREQEAEDKRATDFRAEMAVNPLVLQEDFQKAAQAASQANKPELALQYTKQAQDLAQKAKTTQEKQQEIKSRQTILESFGTDIPDALKERLPTIAATKEGTEFFVSKANESQRKTGLTKIYPNADPSAIALAATSKEATAAALKPILNPDRKMQSVGTNEHGQQVYLEQIGNVEREVVFGLNERGESIKVPNIGKIIKGNLPKDVAEAVSAAIFKAQGVSDARANTEDWQINGQRFISNVGMYEKTKEMMATAGNAYTGSFADQRLALAKIANLLGVGGEPSKMTDSELMEALSSQYVQVIAKTFPGSQSNKELDQLLKSKPNLKQQLPTVLKLLNNIKVEQEADLAAYKTFAAQQVTPSMADFNLKYSEMYGKARKLNELEQKAVKQNNFLSQQDLNMANELRTQLFLK